MKAFLSMALLGIGAVGSFGHVQTSPSFQLAGVSAKGKAGNLEVRLLWIPLKGWMPDSGINVYRVVNGREERLNPSPIGAQSGLLKPDVLAKIRAVATDKTTFSAPSLPLASSKQTFTDLKTLAGQLKTGGTASQNISKLLSSSTAMKSHMAMLVAPPKVKRIIATKKPPATPEQVRASLIFQTLAHPSLSSSLGMSFTDARPIQGQITYEIKGIVGGAEQILSSAVVSVDPNDTTPPTPVGLDALQSGQHSTILHWEPVDPTIQGKLGLTTYRLERVDSKSPSGVALVTDPMVIGLSKTSDGHVIAAPATYTDNAAPTGAEIYRVTTVDAFGRESIPATTSLQMDDIRTPLPVQNITLRTDYANKGAVFGGGVTPVLEAKGYILPAPGLQNLRQMEGQLLNLQFNVFRKVESGNPQTNQVRLLSSHPAPLGLAVSPASEDDLKFADLRKLYGDKVLFDALTGGTFIPVDVFTQSESPLTITQFKAQFLIDYSKSQGAAAAQVAKSGQIIDLLASPIVTFTDPTLPPDTYITYSCTNQFQEVGRQSSEVTSKALPSPLFVSPTTPPSLTASAPVKVASGVLGFYNSSSNAPQTSDGGVFKPGFDQVGSFKGRQRTWGNGQNKFSKPLIDPNNFQHASLGNVAYQVSLNWPAVAQTTGMHYRVYRAIASGLTTGRLPSTNGPGFGPGGKFHSITIGQMVYGYFFDIPTIPAENWVLLADTRDTKLTDNVQHSHALRYAYKVCAVNRWGGQSPLTPETRVTIPASMPPSIPTVTEVTSPFTGGVSISWKVNPSPEQVTKYIVLRKPAAAAQPPSGQASGGGTGGESSSGGTTSRKGGTGHLFQASGPRAEFNKAIYAKFGIKPKTTPVVGFASKIGGLNVKSLVGNITTNVPLSPGELKFLDLASYTTLSTVTFDPTNVTTSTLNFVDTTGEAQTEYLYRLIAVDSDAIGSDGSTPLDAKAYRVSADPIANLTATYVPNQPRCIRLTWQAPATGAVGFMVKRIQMVNGSWQNPSQAITLAVLDKSSGSLPTQFQDKFIRTGQNYRYEIVVLDSSGNLSLITADPTVDSNPIPPATGS